MNKWTMGKEIRVPIVRELDITNFLKDVPNFLKDVPNFLKNVPNFLKDVYRVTKSVSRWIMTSNHFLRVPK